MPSITYPLALPSVSGPVKITWGGESAVAIQEAEFTLQHRVYAWAGQRRSIVVECGMMTLPHAKIWQAFIAKLNGSEGTFYWQDFVGFAAQGSVESEIGYSAKVDGAGQIGPSLATKDWPEAKVNLLKAGDWISMSDRLHMILDDVDSNGVGEATLSIWPHAQQPADNLAILAGSNARGIFRLMSFPDFVWNLDKMMEGFTFAAIEAI